MKDATYFASRLAGCRDATVIAEIVRAVQRDAMEHAAKVCDSIARGYRKSGDDPERTDNGAIAADNSGFEIRHFRDSIK